MWSLCYWVEWRCLSSVSLGCPTKVDTNTNPSCFWIYLDFIYFTYVHSRECSRKCYNECASFLFWFGQSTESQSHADLMIVFHSMKICFINNRCSSLLSFSHFSFLVLRSVCWTARIVHACDRAHHSTQNYSSKTFSCALIGPYIIGQHYHLW